MPVRPDGTICTIRKDSKMFGIGFYNAYSSLVVDIFGGTNASLLVALAMRLIIAIAWYRMFDMANRDGRLAFIPIVGPYMAFRIVWDDFSMAAIFGMTTFIAFIHAIGVVDNPIINACSVINFILWWFMALLTTRVYKVNMLLGFLYGGVPWFGAIVLSFWPSARYAGAWSSDPENEQNLTTQEIKTRRKKAAKAAKRAKEEEKRQRKQSATK